MTGGRHVNCGKVDKNSISREGLDLGISRSKTSTPKTDGCPSRRRPPDIHQEAEFPLFSERRRTALRASSKGRGTAPPAEQRSSCLRTCPTPPPRRIPQQPVAWGLRPCA